LPLTANSRNSFSIPIVVSSAASCIGNIAGV
jgi:hypothetical protein